MNNPYQTPDAHVGHTEHTYQPHFFSASGRIGRVRYWAYAFGANVLLSVLNMLILLAMGVEFSQMGNADSAAMQQVSSINWLFTILMFAIAILFARRRLHDRGHSGWLAALLIIPLVNLIFALYLLFAPGEPGTNRFGPAPAPNSTGVIIVAWIPAIFIVIAIIGIIAAVAIPSLSQ